MSALKYCFVIPHYNHHRAFADFFPRLHALGIPAVIVDDGSDPDSVAAVADMLSGFSETSSLKHHFLKHSVNRGKGAAFFTGTYYARALGFTHVIQIDADGQHDLNDVASLVGLSHQHPEAIISGKPFFDQQAPKIRVYGRRVTDLWVALESFSLQIKDGLCGFRVYPLSQVELILDKYHIGVRMDFDTEILVKAVWLAIPLHFVPTKVIYPENSVSHFHYLRDNLLLITLHMRLLLGMLIRSPALLLRRVKSLF